MGFGPGIAGFDQQPRTAKFMRRRNLLSIQTIATLTGELCKARLIAVKNMGINMYDTFEG
jgi:hypothetical protein